MVKVRTKDSKEEEGDRGGVRGVKDNRRSISYSSSRQLPGRDMGMGSHKVERCGYGDVYVCMYACVDMNMVLCFITACILFCICIFMYSLAYVYILIYQQKCMLRYICL